MLVGAWVLGGRVAMLGAAAALCLVGEGPASAGTAATPPGALGPTRGALPRTARILCRRDGSTRLRTPLVRARADGVHVRVRNRAGEPASITGLGLDFGQGTSQQVSGSAPGRVSIACWPFSRHGGAPPRARSLIIVDPRSLWISPELECAPHDPVQSTILDYAGGASGELGRPVSVARRRLRGLAQEDRLELAAYPRSRHPLVRVMRAGSTVATAGFDPAHRGGWLLARVDACASTRITAR